MEIPFLFLVVLSALVEGQNYAYHGTNSYVPMIKDGVPIDTPEVQAAKAAHFQAFERARALAAKNPSNGQYEGFSVQRNQPSFKQPQTYQQQNYQQQNYQLQNYQQQNYQNNVVLFRPQQQNYAIAAYSSALPVDTPEVQQARAAHLASFPQAQTHHYRYRRGIIHDFQQAPVETPEVQAAKYQHLVAHATAHEADDDDYYQAPHDEIYHFPVVTKKGVPVATAAVKAARQRHMLAHKLEKAGVRYAGGHSHHIPVISPNGVPFDTPEVYIAKTQHLAALAKESGRHNQWGLDGGSLH